MGNYEKEMEQAIIDCIGNHNGVCCMTAAFKSGAKWQAERVNEEKVLDILSDYVVEETNVISVHSFKAVAKEIIALLKGEDEK